jgi:general secretion pathway protein E
MRARVPMPMLIVASLTLAASLAWGAEAATSSPASQPATSAAQPAASPAVPEEHLVSPIGFAVVVAWALACLYCTAWAQLRSLVPQDQKPVLNLALLLTGPIGLAAVFIIRRNPRLKTELDRLLARLPRRRPSISVDPTEPVPIELCNSDGAPVSAIRGKGLPGNETLELAKRIIYEALERRSSDVLIDPRTGDVYLVRYRVDGLLHEVTRLPADQGAAVVNCLKVASRLDIAEKRRPQDGAFVAKLNTREVKFRSATAGTLYGEKIAVRIFDVQTGLMSLDNLGLGTNDTQIVERFMARSDGMMIIAGPTGSGKTTTLYSALNLLEGQGRNIITIEDPIEYPVEHASQTEVNPKANITFASGLRSILRQDPDVILVGEIRDAETAETALQASQTGHLVLSTIHSNDGPTALARLMDFGIEPFLITTGLSTVLSQRLVRVLCPNCKAGAKVSQKLRREAARRQIALGKVSVAVGCDVCDGTGYMGRTGVFEALPLSKKMGQLLMKKPSLATIQAQAQAEKVVTMRQRGIEKVLMGQTTVEEVLRVTTA